MFGLIVSGRPLITEAQTISPTQLAFSVPSSPPFSHLVLFLLPGSTLPPDVSAAVYIQIPPATEFTLLGALSETKPSAIFRTNGVSGAGGVEEEDAMTDAAPGVNIVVGVSLEPTGQVQAALEAMKGKVGMELVKVGAATASPVTTKILAQRIIGNAFNFLASFGSDVIPLKAFEEWWKKFERKVELDPTFLERETA